MEQELERSRAEIRKLRVQASGGTEAEQADKRKFQETVNDLSGKLKAQLIEKDTRIQGFQAEVKALRKENMQLATKARVYKQRKEKYKTEAVQQKIMAESIKD